MADIPYLLLFLASFAFTGYAMKYLDLAKRPNTPGKTLALALLLILASVAIAWISTSDAGAFAVLYAMIFATALAGKLDTMLLKLAAVFALMVTLLGLVLVQNSGFSVVLFPVMAMAFFFDEEFHSRAPSIRNKAVKFVAKHRLAADLVALFMFSYGYLDASTFVGLLLLDLAYQATSWLSESKRSKLFLRVINS